MPQQFLMPYYNQRTDEYGGSFENRARFSPRDARAGPRGGRRRLRDRDAVLRSTRSSADGSATGVDARRASASSSTSTTSSTTGTCSIGGRSNCGRGRRRRRASCERTHQREYTPRSPEVAPTKPVVDVGRFTEPRHDGRGDPLRAVRHHRRRPAVDRRPVPAEEDRGGPPRRHPRVHRLQRLRLAVRAGRPADRLHAERDDRRGVPPRLAPGAVRARPRTPTTTCSSSAPARPGMECAIGARQARHAPRPPRRRRAPRWAARMRWITALPGPGRVGPRGRLPPDPARQAARTSRSSRAPA